MKVALVGAELEENLGLRYMASSLERRGHEAIIVPFDFAEDAAGVVDQVLAQEPGLVGLSMVFTGRAREFCGLADELRRAGYQGHLTAGGHFAALNCGRLLEEFAAFDSIALGEGEELISALADAGGDPSDVPGFCFRAGDGSVRVNPSHGNPADLDALPFPRRTRFHEYFGKPIASLLSSRGCWRSCAFCSIDAWYRSGGGKKFRTRSVGNVVAEMKELYFTHGVRIFNFQDDNFFLPEARQALARFEALREGLAGEGVDNIAIAIKARPDSISEAAIATLDGLGLFRVFLGVENASDHGLRNLNRKSTRAEIESALRILNDFDIHIAYNLLMFEPDATLEDLLLNLRFIERHMDNPFNFCRAEAYAATGLERKLLEYGILRGDYFGFDYRIRDPRVEAFHAIANHAFFDRNFSDYGLHYFNMEVDFTFQLLRRFFPNAVTEHLRADVRSFIKETNIDTFRCLSRIYDLVCALELPDERGIQQAMLRMRQRVDDAGDALRAQGEAVLARLRDAQAAACGQAPPPCVDDLTVRPRGASATAAQGRIGLFGRLPSPIPYEQFRASLGHASNR